MAAKVVSMAINYDEIITISIIDKLYFAVYHVNRPIILLW